MSGHGLRLADNVCVAEQEANILDWLSQIVKDGNASLNVTDTESNFEQDYRRLDSSMINLWALIMKGNTQWELVKIMGQALGEYAKLER